MVDGLVVFGVLVLLARAWSLASSNGGARSQKFSVGIAAALAAVALFMIREIPLAVLAGSAAWYLLFGSSAMQRSWSRAGASAEATRNAPSVRATGMSRAEAFTVLGLNERATEAEIRAAHRRLILQIHPDKGGSTWLAAKINQAKDVLLSRK
jgi:hypothetical protein